MKKLQIFQPIVFNMKEIKMDNILFGQVEKIIQCNAFDGNIFLTEIYEET